MVSHPADRLLNPFVPGLLEVLNALTLSVAAGDSGQTAFSAAAFAGDDFVVLLKQHIGRAA